MLLRPTGLLLNCGVLVSVAKAGATTFDSACTAEEYFATAREAIEAVELDRSDRLSSVGDGGFEMVDESVVVLVSVFTGFDTASAVFVGIAIMPSCGDRNIGWAE